MRWVLITLLPLAGLLVAGLVEPGDPIPPPGEPGATHRPLNPGETEVFLRGRLLFDKDFGVSEGVGPHFNGDSCRACHFDPVIGGAGGVDLNVQRPMMDDGNGGFIPPMETGPLAQTHSIVGVDREEIPSNVAFVEERNTPSTLGLGLIETISQATILAGQAEDANGISGVAHMLPGNVVGRFGWKAQIPTLAAFVRDAMSNEMGITVPDTGDPIGDTSDMDDAPDPELSPQEAGDIAFFIRMLDFPPKGPESPEATRGEALFESVGCVACHHPTMDGVELYSDLLLHDVLGPAFQGVTQGQATSGLYRTPPLRGLRFSAPYFHDGRSATLREAIERHTGEAADIEAAFDALTPAEQADLIAFLMRL
ncbi:MAG: di-heme oxidoredictase family protein [Planctomycetota bacterium]|jgi:CxxC motif-containing protein (DUF1111 family)